MAWVDYLLSLYVNGGWWLVSLCHRPSPYLRPPIAHLSSPTAHLPATISYHPSPTSAAHFPPATGHLPQATSHQPQATSHRPLPNAHLPPPTIQSAQQKQIRSTAGFCCKHFIDKNLLCKTFNQTPTGIMRSAVPFPCFFDVLKSQRVAEQRPQ